MDCSLQKRPMQNFQTQDAMVRCNLLVDSWSKSSSHRVPIILLCPQCRKAKIHAIHFFLDYLFLRAPVPSSLLKAVPFARPLLAPNS